MAHLKALIVRELSPFLMMQDHARAFAGSQSDEHKYQLFMKAMGFEAIMQRQNASEAQIPDSQGAPAEVENKASGNGPTDQLLARCSVV